MISVYVDSAPGTFDQSVEEKMASNAFKQTQSSLYSLAN